MEWKRKRYHDGVLGEASELVVDVDLNETRNENRTMGMVAGKGGVATLTGLTHVTNGTDGTHGIVVTFDGPGGNSSIVNSTVQSKVAQNIPVKHTEFVSLSSDTAGGLGLVVDVVKDGVPVSRRGLRVRAISPELGQAASVITTVSVNGLVRLTSDGVDRVAGAVVSSEGVITSAAGSNVNNDTIGGVVERGVNRNLKVITSELRMSNE